MSARPTLESPRLILRAFKPTDVEPLTRLIGDVDIARYTLSIPHPYEEHHAREWMAVQRKIFARGEGVTFAIVSRETSELCGSVGLRIDRKNARGEIGFWIGMPFRNRGLCSEAALLVLEHGFRTLELNRIFAFHFLRNEASGRVMRKIGMRHEGLLLEHVKKDDEFQDLHVYGILRRDFERRPAMAEYGKKAQDKVEKTMHERKRGTLRSSSGSKVTSRKQAIAIGLSEARAAGGKVPAVKKSASKKSASKKTASRKASSKKTS